MGENGVLFSFLPLVHSPLPNLTPPHLLRTQAICIQHWWECILANLASDVKFHLYFQFRINDPNVQFFNLPLVQSYHFLTLLELQKLEKQRHRCYEELRERIEREKKMKTVSEELQLQKHLMVCGIDLFCFCTFCLQTKLTNSEPGKVLNRVSAVHFSHKLAFFFFWNA